jgi:hypothetical protein
MLRHSVLYLLCLLGLTSHALGDIYVWQGDAGDCTIDHFYNTIQINAAGTYGFRAWNPSTQALEEIQDLTVDASVTGTVTVSVAYDAGGGDGATDIWELDLTAGSGTGNLDDLDISGDLGTVSTVVCDNVTGTVTCVNMPNGITIKTSLTSSGSITASGDIDGTVTIEDGRLDGSLTANMLGDVSLQALVGLVQHNGSISVTSESQAGWPTLRAAKDGGAIFLSRRAA